jgi:hypothetical protein
LRNVLSTLYIYMHITHILGKERVSTRSVTSLATILESELTTIKNAGTWKNERIIVSAQSTNILLANGKKVLNFCANNYLGLSVSF